MDHEECDLFAKLREHMSEAQLVELGKEFRLVKKLLQDSFHVIYALPTSPETLVWSLFEGQEFYG